MAGGRWLAVRSSLSNPAFGAIVRFLRIVIFTTGFFC